MGNQFLGRADTSVKLETPRTIFSQSFDGAADVSGQALVYGTGADTSRYINGGLQVRESGLVENTQSDNRYSPRIGFHWAGRQGSNIIINSAGNFLFTDANDDDYRGVYAKTFIGALQGNATSATTATTATQANKWTTARTIVLTGNASGSVSLDGSANVSLNVSNNYAAASNAANYLVSTDARNSNPSPNQINSLARFEFKSKSVINSPYGLDPSYVGLMSFSPYSDATGGNKYQIAFGSNNAVIPYLSMRTNTGGATSWGDWTLLPTMNQINGYWGFAFPTNNTYLRMPPNGLLPSEPTSTGIGYVGTSSWPFLAMHAKTFYGNLSGNATTATTATSATSATNATNATNATYASMVNGTYTGSGGNQPPSYIPKGKVRFNMMNGLTGIGNVFSGYCDCMLMDTYTGGDVPIVTGFGIARVSGNPRAWIFNGAQGGTGWSKYTELITDVNIASQSVAYSTNSGQLGGIAAASYINTSDTLILRGVV